jgi:hypothetical protein
VPHALADRISHRADPILNSIYHPASTLDAPSSPLHAGSQEVNFGACEETPRTPGPPPLRIYKAYCILQYDTDSNPASYVCLRHERAWCPSFEHSGLHEELLHAGYSLPLAERIGNPALINRVTPAPPSSQFIARLFPSSSNSSHRLPPRPLGTPSGLPAHSHHSGARRGGQTQPTPYAPVQRLVDFNFRKKKPDEVSAIFRTRLTATAKRVSAIFNGSAFGQLYPDTRDSIQRLADQIDWLIEHVEEISQLKEAQQHAIEWGLKHIGTISFKNLRINFVSVAQQLAAVRGLGFFDHVDPKAPTFAPQFCT